MRQTPDYSRRRGQSARSLGGGLCLAFSLGALGCTKLKDNGYAPHSAAVAATPKEAGPCGHATPPDRPAAAAEEPGDIDLVFAARSLDFGDVGTPADAAPALQTLGYDLDGACTGEGDGESCAEPPWAQIAHPDGVDGRDNGISVAFYSLLHGFGSLTAFIGVDPEGKQALILALHGYDGTPNDSQVEVDFYSGSLWDSETDQTGPAPLHDERDRWKIGSAWLEAPDTPGAPYDTGRPKYRDTDAYVTNGMLVSHFRSVLMGDAYLPAGPLYQAIVTGSIDQTDGKWGIHDGVIAGRWLTGDLLRLVSYYADEASHRSLCADSASFKQAKQQFCPYIDIRVEGGNPSLPCDGMSMAYAFESDPASLGPVVDNVPSPQTCTPSNDPVTHGCGTE